MYVCIYTEGRVERISRDKRVSTLHCTFATTESLCGWLEEDPNKIWAEKSKNIQWSNVFTTLSNKILPLVKKKKRDFLISRGNVSFHGLSSVVCPQVCQTSPNLRIWQFFYLEVNLNKTYWKLKKRLNSSLVWIKFEIYSHNIVQLASRK